MPMIRGRYYMNRTMGEALEKARAESEAQQGGENPSEAAGALGRRARSAKADKISREGDGEGLGHGSGHGAGRACHLARVEIECANGGYIARVHHHVAVPSGSHAAHPAAHRAAGHLLAENGPPHPNSVEMHSQKYFAQPGTERAGHTHLSTHVFTSQEDLLNFLREELAPRAHTREA